MIEPLRHRMYFEEEVRAAGDPSPLPPIEGHAIVTNVRAGNSLFTEEVADEAVHLALADKELDVVSLWNHDMSQPLGRTPDTLELSQDSKGLFTRTMPSDTTYARDLVKNIQAGIVKQMSFGFYIIREDLIQNKAQPPHFIIREIKLFDVSPVTFPFYKQTDLWIAQRAQHLAQRMERHGIRMDPAAEMERYKRSVAVEKARAGLF